MSGVGWLLERIQNSVLITYDTVRRVLFPFDVFESRVAFNLKIKVTAIPIARIIFT